MTIARRTPRGGRFGLLTLILVATVSTAAQATPFEKLHEFPGLQASPQTALLHLEDGSFLGTTLFGTQGGGSVFKLTPDGQGGYVFSTLHSFDPVTEGNGPAGALIRGSDGNFYGTTQVAGPSGHGTVFRMTAAGDVTILHAFDQNGDDSPSSALLEGADGDFYGTTQNGGTEGVGSIFKVTPEGVVTTLHAFEGTDGWFPSPLVQSTSGDFYGTATFVGDYGDGLAFKMTPSGTYTILHSFQASVDGAFPYAALIQGQDGDLYGATSAGGDDDAGTVFRMTPAGVVTLLHSFQAATDGSDPSAGPLFQAADGTLYGVTRLGGTNGNGTAFKLSTAGDFTLLHEFQGPDGRQPEDGLILAEGGDFYGTTIGGGSDGLGTVFKMSPAGAVTTLHSLQFPSDGRNPGSALVQGVDGDFYGTTSVGGGANGGTIFRLTASGQFEALHELQGTEGAGPRDGLVQGTDGDSYCAAYGGGEHGVGTIFKVESDGTVTVLHAFDAVVDGINPAASPTQASDGNFYGTTTRGGEQGNGVLYRMTPAGVVTTLHSFAYQTDGIEPQARLIQADDGYLYGTTFRGGANGHGTLFRSTLDGAVTTLHSFAYGIDGANPTHALLQAADGYLYGTARAGGAHGWGTVFTVSGDGSVATLHSFDRDVDGAGPTGPLTQASDGNIYGTAFRDGVGKRGTLYSINAGGELTVLDPLQDYYQGASPSGGVIVADDGRLYGTTSSGGRGSGTIFRFTPEGIFRGGFE